jgi:dephospho-CoA kinase
MVLEIFGGVGSGKSLVLEILREQYGAEVIGMDETAHRLYEPGQPGHRAVTSLLGDEVVRPDGTLDRQKMAGILYRDQEAMQALEKVIHPLVYQEVEREVREAAERCGLVVVETALPEKTKSDIYDELWYVYTPEQIREERLMESRGYTRERVREIMSRQLPEEAFRDMADWVLVNDSTKEALEERIRERLTERL